MKKKMNQALLREDWQQRVYEANKAWKIPSPWGPRQIVEGLKQLGLLGSGDPAEFDAVERYGRAAAREVFRLVRTARDFDSVKMFIADELDKLKYGSVDHLDPRDRSIYLSRRETLVEVLDFLNGRRQ